MSAPPIAWHLVSWCDHTHVALYCDADGNAPDVYSAGDVDVATCVACLGAAAAHARTMLEAVERRRAQLGQGSG